MTSNKKGWARFTGRLAVALVLLLIVFSVLPLGRRCWQSLFRLSGFSAETDAPLSIHVIDVGKADAILLECEGHAALLDAGTDLRGEAVADYLARCGVKRLDLVIASHPDKDHAGGIPTVLSELECGRFLRSRFFHEEYGQIDEVLRSKSIPQALLVPGDTLTLGGATMQVLGPLDEYEETNDASLVLKLEYNGFTALFCGDIEKDAEKDLIKAGVDLSADLLKVPHHGSASSCSKRFLLEVEPVYAVISVGEDRNDLPSEKTLQRLEEVGAEVLRTDVDGTVIFTWKDGAIEILKEK